MHKFQFGIAAIALLLATQSLLAEVEKVPIETWIAELSSDDSAHAKLAAEMLGEMKVKAAPAIPALVKALTDQRGAADDSGISTSVRDSAAEALAAIGEPAVPALLGVLEKAKDEELRFCVLHCLGQMGRPAAKAIPPLTAIITSNASEHERFYAFDALTSIHPPNPEFVTFAMSRLNDKSPALRSIAIRVLGNCGKDAAPAVVELSKLLADAEDRAEAISADMIGQRPLRADAADALGKIGPSAAAAIPRLNKMMLSDKNAVARTMAAVALVRIEPKNKTGLAFLKSLLGGSPKERSNKIAAARGLRELGPVAKDSLPALTKLLHHKDRDVRFGAMEAIAEIGGKDAIPLLEPVLDDKDETIRGMAKGRIERLKSPAKTLESSPNK